MSSRARSTPDPRRSELRVEMLRPSPGPMLWMACLLTMSLPGCGLPTWSELIGAKPENTGPVNVVPVVPVAPPPQQVVIETPPAPPKPNAAEVIAEFQACKPHLIDDAMLAKVASLEEGLETVNEIDLRGSMLTLAGAQHLPKFTHLAKLDMRGTHLRDEQLSPLGNISSLQELNLDGSNVGPFSVPSLRKLSNLRILRAENLHLPPLVWQDLLTSLPNLMELRINNCNLPDPLMPFVARLEHLTHLDMAGAPVTDEGLQHLALLNNLESLTVNDCRIHGFGLRSSNSKGFRNLTRLSILNTPLDERGAKAIAQMKNLKVLWIGGMPTMLDGHFQMIVRPLKELEFISCSHNSSLSGQAFLGVVGHEHLQEIRMDGCSRVDDVALRHLAKVETLKRIDLSGTACTIQGVLSLKESLPEVEVVGLE